MASRPPRRAEVHTITTNLAERFSGLAAAALLRSDAAVTPRTLHQCASRLARSSTTVALAERRADLFFFGKGIIIIYDTAAELVLADVAPLRAEAVPRPRPSLRGRASPWAFPICSAF